MSSQWFAPDDYGTYRTLEECAAIERARDRARDAVEIKKQNLAKWMGDAAERSANSVHLGKMASDAAHAEFVRAKAAYEEHCREFGLVAYATYDVD